MSANVQRGAATLGSMGVSSTSEREHKQAVYVDLTFDELQRCLQIAELENRRLREQLKQFIQEGIARRPAPVIAA